MNYSLQILDTNIRSISEIRCNARHFQDAVTRLPRIHFAQILRGFVAQILHRMMFR